MKQILHINPNKVEVNTLFIQPTHYCGLNCDGCCPAGTMISTPKGKVPIEQIQEGDEVYAYDSSLKQAVVSHVGHTYLREAHEVFEILVGESVLRVTGEHPVMTRRGWVEAKNLTLDDEVLCDEDHIK